MILKFYADIDITFEFDFDFQHFLFYAILMQEKPTEQNADGNKLHEVSVSFFL